MRVTLDYGRTGLEVELKDEWRPQLLDIRAAVPLDNPEQAIRAALADPIGTAPLAKLAKGRTSACILVCDVTRPVPNRLILPPILETIEAAGVPRDQILILVATGMHRPNVGAELVEMLSEEIVKNYRVENHDHKDDAMHRRIGVTPSGIPANIDRRYLDADLKITTGLVEPHLMAGYSGGRKLICPGIASLETVRAWHSPRFIEHPNATCGVIEGNPVHEENTRIALMAGCDFIVNVCIDGARRITHVSAGDMIQAWARAVAACERQVKATLKEPADVVVTSSAGHPLDATFYQSVKGLTGVLSIVKNGGTIVLAASMSEGIGSPEFRRLLDETDDLDQFMQRIWSKDFFVMDQWQLEELAKVVRHCRVKVVTDGLPPEKLQKCFVEPAPSVESAVATSLAQYGPNARLAVVPKGPYVLPLLA